jgi:flagellar biosynthesis protein
MKQPSPKRKASAVLKYAPPSDQAPQLRSKGQGVVADALIRRAQEASIPIREDRDLLQLLLQLDLDETIPQELDQVLPEILAFIYHVHKEFQSTHTIP